MDAEQLDLVLEYGMQVLSGDRNALPCRVKDEALRHTLAFGIGIHHAGLEKSDRIVVENLFLTGKIQVLICTATCAWGVNFPAHLVIIKGTEYFDADTGRYVPFPVTDVLQMMGRSGRPGFDEKGVAMIFVAEALKNFYKRFLYEPFPVESQLLPRLADHINAEISNKTIQSRMDGFFYLSWTFFYRRILKNPSYYGLHADALEDDRYSVARNDSCRVTRGELHLRHPR